MLLGSHRSTTENRKYADLYLKLPVAETGMLDFAALDELIDIGYRSALPALESWRQKNREAQ